MLLNAKSDIDATDNGGLTALMLAAAMGHVETVRVRLSVVMDCHCPSAVIAGCNLQRQSCCV